MYHTVPMQFQIRVLKTMEAALISVYSATLILNALRVHVPMGCIYLLTRGTAFQVLTCSQIMHAYVCVS